MRTSARLGNSISMAHESTAWSASVTARKFELTELDAAFGMPVLPSFRFQ
jgi:hypothetical protein